MSIYTTYYENDTCPDTTITLVVEITPIGIQTLEWRLYIIWVVFNAAFVPIVYLFYPETADRTLEDIDRLFRENPKIIVCNDKEAISPHRPRGYVEYEQAEVRRNSSIDPRMLRRASRVMKRGSMPMPEEEFVEKV